MTKRTILSLLLALGGVTALPGAEARDRRSDQAEVRADFSARTVLSLRDIEQRVLPRMGGHEYLGPEYDPRARIYRLKFLANGRVTFVDVDAATGRVLNRR